MTISFPATATILLTCVLVTGDLGLPVFNMRVRAQLFDDVLFAVVYQNSIILISRKISPNETSYGTGFLASYASGIMPSGVGEHFKSKSVYLITNKHVLPAENRNESIKIRIGKREKDKQTPVWLEIPITGDNGTYLPGIQINKNGADIAVLDVTKQLQALNDEFLYKFGTLPVPVLITNKRLAEQGIDMGEDIYVLGFPDSVHDPSTFSPIIRRGIIASDINQGFKFDGYRKSEYGFPDKLNGFLIDAQIFPGSSGSLVILKPRKSLHPELGVKDKPYPWLLGIVSDSIPVNDTALKNKQRMGLGVVYSSQSILETIGQFPYEADSIKLLCEECTVKQ